MSTPMEFEARFKYKQIPDIIQPIGLNCNRCWDSGTAFILVDLGDGLKHSVWVFCRCLVGRNKKDCDQYQLPIYEYEMERLFPIKQFPYQIFIPSSFHSFKQGLDNKMVAYKKSLREAELFWRSQCPNQ